MTCGPSHMDTIGVFFNLFCIAFVSARAALAYRRSCLEQNGRRQGASPSPSLMSLKMLESAVLVIYAMIILIFCIVDLSIYVRSRGSDGIDRLSCVLAFGIQWGLLNLAAACLLARLSGGWSMLVMVLTLRAWETVQLIPVLFSSSNGARDIYPIMALILISLLTTHLCEVCACVALRCAALHLAFGTLHCGCIAVTWGCGALHCVRVCMRVDEIHPIIHPGLSSRCSSQG